MGQRAKWLQDERYIRIAGALLMVSPLTNYLLSVALNSNTHNKWSLQSLFAGYMLATGFVWFGRISNFIVGFLMFRGKSSAWVPVLAILGFTIAKNLYTFKHDYLVNQAQTIISLLINIALFLLVFESEYRLNRELNLKIQQARAEREVLAKKAKEAAVLKSVTQNSPTSMMTASARKDSVDTSIPKATVKAVIEKTPPKALSTAPQQKMPAKPLQDLLIFKGMAIDFLGHGKIAEVLHCTESELWVTPTNHLPRDIHKRTVTLQKPGQVGTIRLRLSGIRENSTLVFRVIES